MATTDTAHATSADNTAKQVRGRPFKPGAEWSGNEKGRPKSARSKLSEDFISTLAADFEKNGKEAIEKVRTEKPAEYLRVVASIVPKTLDLDDPEDEDGVFGVALITKSAITALIERGRQDGGD